MIFVSPKKRGFTLVEVVIATSIVLLLSLVALMSVQDARKKGRDTQRLSDIDQISLALRMYSDATGVYPPSTSNGSLDALNVLVPGYLPSLPNDPLNTGARPDWAWSNQDTYYYWGPGSVGTCGPYAFTLWYRMEAKTNGTAESCVHLDNNSYTRHSNN